MSVIKPHTPEVIAAALAVARRRSGMSKRDVAKRLHGNDAERRNDVSRWENAIAAPTIMDLMDISVALGCAPGAILDLIFVLNRDLCGRYGASIEWIHTLAEYRASEHL